MADLTNEVYKKLIIEIEELREQLIEPKFVLVTKISYGLLIWKMNSMRLTKETEDKKVFGLIDKFTFMNEELEIIIVEPPSGTDRETFLKVVPSASTHYTRLK